MTTTDKLNSMEEADLIRALASLPESEAPEDLSRKIMDGISRTDALPYKKRSSVFYPALAAGLALLVCLAVFNFKVRISKENPAQFFKKGAALLSQGMLEQALPCFEKAASLNPDDAEVFFYLGMNHGRLNHFQEEQNAYLKAIEVKPDFIQAHYFLGHSYMSQKEWEKAASAYDKVLSIDSGFENAFYNKGLALEKSGKTQEALAAWKNYLAIQKTGVWAQRAVSRINAHGDFTYRPSRIGKQKIIMGSFQVQDSSKALQVSDDSLKRLGESLNKSNDMDLFVMVYMKGSPETAKLRALSIKNKLLEHCPDVRSNRIKLSWFGQEDKVSAGDTLFSLEQSIRFLGIKSNILDEGVNS